LKIKNNSEFITVFVAESYIEADFIKAALEKEGIQVIFQSYYDSAYNGIFILQKGFGEVKVLHKDFIRAKNIVEKLLEFYRKNGKL